MLLDLIRIALKLIVDAGLEVRELVEVEIDENGAVGVGWTPSYSNLYQFRC